MFSALADIVIGFFEFVMDVLLFRGQRRAQGHRERSAMEDTIEVARFDFVTLFFIALVSAGLMFVLTFAFGVPAGWSIGIGLTVGAIWGSGGTTGWCASHDGHAPLVASRGPPVCRVLRYRRDRQGRLQAFCTARIIQPL